MKVRQFNEEGIEKFRTFLEEYSNEPTQKTDSWMEILSDTRFTDDFEFEIDLEPQTLVKRTDFTEILATKFQNVPESRLRNNRKLWSWLSLFYFESLCPSGLLGIRQLSREQAYILNTISMRETTQHLLYMIWEIYHLAMKTDSLQYAMIFLDRPINIIGNLTAETFRRVNVSRLKCFFELIYRLYWNEETQSLRPRILQTGKDDIYSGDLTHRLPACLSQLAATYDLYGITAEKLIELLGPEFQPENIGHKNE